MERLLNTLNLFNLSTHKLCSRSIQFIICLELIPAIGISLFAAVIISYYNGPAFEMIPIIFAGSWLVYLSDRSKIELEDAVNVPSRVALKKQFKSIQKHAQKCAMILLVAYPIIIDATIYLILFPGLLLALIYTYKLPFIEVRVKDIALIKSIYPALGISMSMFIPVLIKPEAYELSHCFTLFSWAFTLILANTLSCDQRDEAGDRQNNIKTLSVCLGKKKCQFIIILLSLISIFISLKINLIFTLCSAYLLIILCNRSLKQSKHYYSWWTESFLFALPLLFCANRFILLVLTWR